MRPGKKKLVNLVEYGLLGRVALHTGNLDSSLQGQTLSKGRILDVLWWDIPGIDGGFSWNRVYSLSNL